DVAARIGRRDNGRNRRVAALVVLGLVVGGVGGYAVGRVVHDDTHAVTVGGAPEPAGGGNTSTAEATPATQGTGVTSITVCSQPDLQDGTGNAGCSSGLPRTLPEPGPNQPADPSAARE